MAINEFGNNSSNHIQSYPGLTTSSGPSLQSPQSFCRTTTTSPTLANRMLQVLPSQSMSPCLRLYFQAASPNQGFSWITSPNQATVSTLPFSFASNTANYSAFSNNQDTLAHPNSFTQPFPSQPSSNNSFSYLPQNPSTSSNNQFVAAPSDQSFSWITSPNQATVSTLPFSFASNTANYSAFSNNQNTSADPNSFTQLFPLQSSSSNNSFSYPPQNPSTSSNNQFVAAPSNQSFSWITSPNQATVSILPFSFAPNTANYSSSFNNQFEVPQKNQGTLADPNSFTQPLHSQPSSNNSFSYPPQNPSTSNPKNYCKVKNPKKSTNKRWDKSNLIRRSSQLLYKLIHSSGFKKTELTEKLFKSFPDTAKKTVSIEYLKKTYENLKAACDNFEDKSGLSVLATKDIPSNINKKVAQKVDAFLKKNPKYYLNIEACMEATSKFCSAIDEKRLSFLEKLKNAKPEEIDKINALYIESIREIANLYAAKKELTSRNSSS